MFTNQQIEAINHNEGPALVLAVPGAGKTMVLIHRARRLIKEKHSTPNRILSITYSKSAAVDMKQRYRAFFPTFGEPPIFMTIHAFCYQILRKYESRLTLIEDAFQNQNKYAIIKQLYYNINGFVLTEEKLEAFFTHSSYIKNKCISVSEYLKENKVDLENFSKLYLAYEKYKSDKSLIDFDDMLSRVQDLLINNKAVLSKVKDSFDFIQLDEGQDTSLLQLNIIKTLAKPKDNLFIVADDDQSIYGFRGASPEALLMFKDSFPKGKLFFMEQNHRSTSNIVKLSNVFIASNENRYKKNSKTNNVEGNPIQVKIFKSAKEQYDYIINEISLYGSDNIAVLYRNNLSCISLVNKMIQEGLDFSISDFKSSLFKHKVIYDIFNFIEIANNPKDYALYSKMYYKTKGYISKTMINWLLSTTPNSSIFKQLTLYPGQNYFYLKQLRELELDFLRLKTLSPSKAIEYIEKEIGYGDYLHENSQRIGYTYHSMQELLFHLKEVAATTDSFTEFKEKLNYLSEITKSNTRKNSKVTLSTVHSSKGLEFDKVFVIDLVEGSFPSMNALELAECGYMSQLEEERRLFYVAMTRAKRELTLCTYKKMDDRFVDPSSFLLEIKDRV